MTDRGRHRQQRRLGPRVVHHAAAVAHALELAGQALALALLGLLPQNTSRIAGRIALGAAQDAVAVGIDAVEQRHRTRDGFRLRHRTVAVGIGAISAVLSVGGTLGIGTVLYALAIGPLTQAFLPSLTVRLDDGTERPPAAPTA